MWLLKALLNLVVFQRRFLEDARDTVLDRIRDVMDGYNSVKVNTAFIGEFVSGDKIGVKTIVTIVTRIICFYLFPTCESVLNLQGVKFPMSLNRITRFERINDISINVYTVRDKKEGKGGCRVVPLRLTDDKKDRHINLLYFDDTMRRDNATHFAWIKNLSRLVGSQLSGRQNKSHICDRCMPYFRTSDKLSAHSVDSGRMNECAIVLPTKDDKWLEFRNYSRKERLPSVVYADLECVLKKKEERRTSNTSIVQHHESGEGCVLSFVKEPHDLAFRARTILDTDAHMTDLTPDEWERFVNATRCSVCERPFESGDARVRDHCHLTGRYRGPAHSNCNLNYKDTYVIPVFFHNLSGYDAHFIIKDVANAFSGSVEVLPITKETYISFTKNVEDAWDERWFGRRLKLRFVDSFKFLSASLEKLSSYLDKSELRIARSEFSDLSDADFELLARKGVFPSEYVDDVDKLLETRLPPREAFHSSLTGDAISESDYAHAIRVWERFRVETLGDYSDLCLKSDVLLLADVFENFRDACMRSYNLDPAYYYTLPGYTWDAMLKYTGVRFELLPDIDMVMFMERGIRGGLSQCSNRYARANNKFSMGR
ncbi:uncharacterized protein [Polyergus mexicanus]|uniref:uncharacterized protein n=1 Tax=Polyergus mexicanus TaxID=615972 RepID=UPI0038B6726F